MTLRTLSLLEARVLGVLVEKQHTVADSYPLSLNALLMGCNQKTARDPGINASESELLVAVDALNALSLGVEVSGSRVSRYEHNVNRVLGRPGISPRAARVTVCDGTGLRTVEVDKRSEPATWRALKKRPETVRFLPHDAPEPMPGTDA